MKYFLYTAGAVVGACVLWFAYYALSPLFIHIKVDEALPQQEQQAQAQPQGQAVAGATVIGSAGHPASGSARIVTAEGKSYIRYENFKTINGPDLYVYLAKDLDAKEFVSLGQIRATEGNINYEIPIAINPSDYKYVLTWCKQFSVLFNYADLQTH